MSDPDPTKPVAPPSLWVRSRDRLVALQQEYGGVAIGTYLVLYAAVWVGFVIALQRGWSPEGAAAETGLFVAAWAAAKVTQPARILATVALTPLVARGLKRVRGSRTSAR
jgi:hypothetical protein